VCQGKIFGVLVPGSGTNGVYRSHLSRMDSAVADTAVGWPVLEEVDE